MGASRVNSFKGYNADNTWNGNNGFYSDSFTAQVSTSIDLTVLGGGQMRYDTAGVTVGIAPTGSYLIESSGIGGATLFQVNQNTDLTTFYQDVKTTSGKDFTFTGLGTDVLTYLNGSSVVKAASVTSPVQFSSGVLSLATIDISDDTNLAVTAPIVLTDDTISFDETANFTSGGVGAWTGNHDFGVDGSSAFDLNLYTDESGAQLTWDSAPASATDPVLSYVGKDSPHLRHINVSVTSNSVIGSGQLQLIAGTVNMNQTTGGTGIAIPMAFTINDNRVIDSGAGIDFIRGMSFVLNRSATFSSNLSGAAALQGIFFNLTDGGTYSGNSTGLATTAFQFEGQINGVFNGTAAQKYTINVLNFTTTLAGTGSNLANLTYAFNGITCKPAVIVVPGFAGPAVLDFIGSNWSPGLNLIGAGTGSIFYPFRCESALNVAWGTAKIFSYEPTVTAANWDAEYVVYASRSGIALASDGVSGTDSGGRLVLGAAEDAEIYYDGTDLQINPKLVGSGFAVVAGTLQVDEGVVTNDVTQSSTTTIATTDVVHLADATSGAITLTLPAAASNTGANLWVKKTDSSANAVTIDGNASETIDGATTFALTAQHESVHLYCDGTGWFII